MGLADEFELEHYRYLTSRIASTNDNTIKIVSAFSAVATLIVTGLVTIGLSFRQLGVQADQAIVYAQTLLALLLTSSGLAILVMVINAIAWFDYRMQETRLLSGHGVSRQPPTFRSMPRWIETYLILIILTGTLAIWFIASTQLLPTIK